MCSVFGFNNFEIYMKWSLLNMNNNALTFCKYGLLFSVLKYTNYLAMYLAFKFFYP